MAENRLLKRLNAGETLLGIFSQMPSPTVQEMIALSGYDFSVVDMEHGVLDYVVVEDMVRALQGRGALAAVRVSPGDIKSIGKVLDFGADIVLVPQIENREMGEKAVDAAKFPPMGHRGAAHVVRAGRYSTMNKVQYFAEANVITSVALQIEGLEAAKHADEIMSIEGVDIIFLGPHDLAQSLGVPGQPEHPKVVEKMEELVKLAREKGKFLGTYVESVEMFKKWSDAGVQFLAYQSDIDTMASKLMERASEAKKAVGRE